MIMQVAIKKEAIMKRKFTLATAVLIGIQSLSAPAFALSDDEKNALAAAAILGLAALAHNEHHDRDTSAAKDPEYKAIFERGYRDGLYNEPYDSRHSSTAYANGYDAGHMERANNLAYKTNNVGGMKVPQAALNSCVSEVASSLNVGSHHVHVIKAGQEGSDNYYIELAAGHRHLICATNGAGQVFNMRDGRL